jgi:hypothetical protein
MRLDRIIKGYLLEFIIHSKYETNHLFPHAFNNISETPLQNIKNIVFPPVSQTRQSDEVEEGWDSVLTINS